MTPRQRLQSQWGWMLVWHVPALAATVALAGCLPPLGTTCRQEAMQALGPIGFRLLFFTWVPATLSYLSLVQAWEDWNRSQTSTPTAALLWMQVAVPLDLLALGLYGFFLPKALLEGSPDLALLDSFYFWIMGVFANSIYVASLTRAWLESLRAHPEDRPWLFGFLPFLLLSLGSLAAGFGIGPEATGAWVGAWFLALLGFGVLARSRLRAS